MSCTPSRRIRGLALVVALGLVAIHSAACGRVADVSDADAVAPPELLRSIRSQTYAHKTVGELQIKADGHRFDDDVARPVGLM